MNKTDRCVEIIKSFLESLKGKVESVVLKSGTVRKWEEINVLCENKDSAMICTAMKRTTECYEYEIRKNVLDSTTLIIEYKLNK